MSRTRTGVAVLSLVALYQGSKAPPAAAGDAVNVEVNFGIETPRKSQTGFLHGFSAGAPADKRIEPLKPAWWRTYASTDLTLYERATALGAQVQVVVSDSYGYPLNDWNGNGPPYENWQRWEDHVRSMANAYRGLPVFFDIWNEPDVADWNQTVFWNGTAEQHYETYKRAYQVLRQELGDDVQIGGPSLANYDEDALRAFLDYCKKNNLQVNFLTWHELFAGDDHTPAIAAHIQTFRKLKKKKYKKLEISQILINEYGGPNYQYHPGAILAYLYYLEEGGADGANKACWDDSKGVNNCFNESLDGILDKKGKPRAAWWTYKTYADAIDSRVEAESDSPESIVALASKSPALVLIGSFGKDSDPKASLMLSLKNLGEAGVEGSKATVIVYKIPASSEKKVKRLKKISTEIVDVAGGTAIVSLPDIKHFEQFVVEVSD